MTPPLVIHYLWKLNLKGNKNENTDSLWPGGLIKVIHYSLLFHSSFLAMPVALPCLLNLNSNKLSYLKFIHVLYTLEILPKMKWHSANIYGKTFLGPLLCGCFLQDAQKVLKISVLGIFRYIERVPQYVFIKKYVF